MTVGNIQHILPYIMYDLGPPPRTVAGVTQTCTELLTSPLGEKGIDVHQLGQQHVWKVIARFLPEHHRTRQHVDWRHIRIRTHYMPSLVTLHVFDLPKDHFLSLQHTTITNYIFSLPNEILSVTKGFVQLSN